MVYPESQMSGCSKILQIFRSIIYNILKIIIKILYIVTRAHHPVCNLERSSFKQQTQSRCFPEVEIDAVPFCQAINSTLQLTSNSLKSYSLLIDGTARLPFAIQGLVVIIVNYQILFTEYMYKN